MDNSGTISSPIEDNRLTDAGGPSRQYAYREALRPWLLGRVAIMMTVYLGAYLTLCPVGAREAPWVQRLAFTGFGAALCVFMCHAEYVVTLYLTRRRSPLHVALAVAGAALLTTPASTAIIYGVDTVSFRQLSEFHLTTVYASVLFSTLLCSAMVHCLLTRRLKRVPVKPNGLEQIETATAEAAGVSEAAAEAKVQETAAGSLDDSPARGALETERTKPQPAPAHSATAPAGAASALADRLPAEIGQDVIHLTMNDHYVTVVTTSGRCELLMRFTDAVEELGSRGMRVHRSHWIAFDHVEGWGKRDQRPVLRLTGGHTIPVSRSYLAQARAAVAAHQISSADDKC